MLAAVLLCLQNDAFPSQDREGTPSERFLVVIKNRVNSDSVDDGG